VGTVATTAVLASCLVRAQGSAERYSGAEARREPAPADVRPPVNEVKPPPKGVRVPDAEAPPLARWEYAWQSFIPNPPAIAEEELGQRKVQRVPHEPLPNQERAPCRGSATALHGSCWFRVHGLTAPCPIDTFQEGDGCYVPIATNPKAPVGEHPNSGSRREGHEEASGN
jgi:hypothetical protein